MEEYYILCEDSPEGIFTGIYDAYLLKKPHERIHLMVKEEDNYRLFANYLTCKPDGEKACRVARTIRKQFGLEAYLAIFRAVSSAKEDKAEAVYKTVVTGLSMKNPVKVLENLKDPFVHRVFEIARRVGNETHGHVEFLRFRELRSGLLYAQIAPQNDVLAFIVPHFADRLPLENFIIHDKGRNLFAVHPARQDWYLYSGTEETELLIGEAAEDFSEGEEKYSELFTAFFHTIEIKQRKNYELQRNMLPLKYRKYMTEFIYGNKGL